MKSFRAKMSSGLLSAAVFLTAVGCSDDLGTPEESPESEIVESVGSKSDWIKSGNKLRIVELLSAPVESNGAFIEILNVTAEPLELVGDTISFGNRKISLVAFGERAHIIPPNGIALVVDKELDLQKTEIPYWTPIVTTSRDLGDLLKSSRKLILREKGKREYDRVNGDLPAVAKGIALERNVDGSLVASPRGASPGERNSISTQGRSLITSYFATPPYDRTDPVMIKFVEVVDSAKKTIDGAFFQIDNPQAIDAFVRAVARGVRVRIVTDARYSADPDYLPGYQRLVAGGVTLVEDRRSALMHNKFMIVDSEAVWTGSYNLLSHEGIAVTFKHTDNAIYVKNKPFAAMHQTEFDEMVGGLFGLKKKDNTPHEQFVDGMRIRTYFSPTDKPFKNVILNEVNRAKDNIYFLSFSFAQAALGDALVARYRAGVDVRGVFDDRGTNGNGSQYPKLIEAGADIRRPTVPLFLHHKFLIIDYGTADPVVITGSYNFSDSAENENDEALYVIHDRELAEAYYRVYRATYDDVVAEGPNTDPIGFSQFKFEQVMSRQAGLGAVPATSPFVTLKNYDSVPATISDLVLSDRDGLRLDLAALSNRATVPPNGTLRIMLPADSAIEPNDALTIYDAKRRQISTFDAPRYAGPGQVLTRVAVNTATTLPQDFSATYLPSTWAAAAESSQLVSP